MTTCGSRGVRPRLSALGEIRPNTGRASALPAAEELPIAADTPPVPHIAAEHFDRDRVDPATAE